MTGKDGIQCLNLVGYIVVRLRAVLTEGVVTARVPAAATLTV